jgi:predicted nucleic acid-binding protein
MSETVVVSDTSCLIVLERIKELPLLENLFSEIEITEEVAAEFGEKLPNWIKVGAVKDKEKTKFLELNLDTGEASSIAYCLEKTGSVLLVIDERKGRRIARELNLNIIGTLGLIVKAREKGIITSVAAILDKLEKADFRISHNLKNGILEMFGE